MHVFMGRSSPAIRLNLSNLGGSAGGKIDFVNDYGRTDAFSTLAHLGQGDRPIGPSRLGSQFELSTGTKSLEPRYQYRFCTWQRSTAGCNTV